MFIDSSLAQRLAQMEEEIRLLKGGHYLIPTPPLRIDPIFGTGASLAWDGPVADVQYATVTSATTTSGRYPGLLLIHQPSQAAGSRWVLGRQVWIEAPNDETLEVGRRYRVWGSRTDGGRPVYLTDSQCCEEGSGSEDTTVSKTCCPGTITEGQKCITLTGVGTPEEIRGVPIPMAYNSGVGAWTGFSSVLCDSGSIDRYFGIILKCTGSSWRLIFLSITHTMTAGEWPQWFLDYDFGAYWGLEAGMPSTGEIVVASGDVSCGPPLYIQGSYTLDAGAVEQGTATSHSGEAITYEIVDGACPEDTGSGGIVATSRGDNNGKATDTISTTIAVPADEVLIVSVVVLRNIDPEGAAEYNGETLEKRITIPFGSDSWLEIYTLKLNLDGSAGATLIWQAGTGGVNAVAMVATSVSGLASAVPVSSAYATGTSTTPSVALVSDVPAGRYVIGIVGTQGPETDTDGTWQNGFADGGNDEGTTGGIDANNVRVCEGDIVTSTTLTGNVNKTGITSRGWVAYYAEFN